MNLYDLALCIDKNDNRMTFVGHIVYLSLVASLAPEREAQGRKRCYSGHKINYMPSKSCDCPINNQYARPNDKLSSVKHAFLRAKRELRALKVHFAP